MLKIRQKEKVSENMENTDIRALVQFSILDGLYWAFFAAYAGYITAHFLNCGLSSAALSLALAVFMAFSFAGSFFWGSVCDRKKTNRKVFLGEFTAALIAGLLIYQLAYFNVMIAAFLYPLFGFLVSPLGSNLDAWMLRSFHHDGAVYGKARSIGSAGYAVAMLICGQIIARAGYKMLPLMTLVFAIPVLLLAGVIRETPYENHLAAGEKADMKQLFKVGPYILLLVILFLTGLAMAPINNLKIVLIQSTGGDVSILGIDQFLGVMVQAAAIFFSGNLRTIKPKLRLFLMSVLVLATMFCTALAWSPLLIIAGTMLSNLSYGIMLPTQREITEDYVPSALITTAHSLADAMFGSFSGVIALLYSGFVMDTFGAKSVAVLGGVIMIVPILIALIALLKRNNNQ